MNYMSQSDFLELDRLLGACARMLRNKAWTTPSKLDLDDVRASLDRCARLSFIDPNVGPLVKRVGKVAAHLTVERLSTANVEELFAGIFQAQQLARLTYVPKPRRPKAAGPAEEDGLDFIRDLVLDAPAFPETKAGSVASEPTPSQPRAPVSRSDLAAAAEAAAREAAETGAGASSPASGSASAPASAPREELRYLTASGPTAVSRGKSFSVGAHIDVQPAGSTSRALGLLSIPKAGLKVTLVAMPQTPGTLLSIGSVSADVLVRANVASEQVQFSFEALAIGPAEVVIRVYVGHAYRGEVTLRFEVTEAESRDSVQAVDGKISTRAASEEDATLEIEYDESSKRYRFGLRGADRIGVHVYKQSLDADPQQFVVQIASQLNDLARARGNATPLAIETALQGMGGELWAKLLPTELKAKLVENWETIKRVTLLTVNDPIPWELLYCREHDRFVADQWQLNRWCYGSPASEQVGLGSPVYVLPTTAPRAAFDEVDALKKIFPSKDVWCTVDDLIRGLKEGRVGLLHIAAHNSVDYSSALNARIKLDADFTQAILSGFKRSALARSPLVFLNACSSATSVQQWVGSTSWASRFLEIGAGAFIGSLWEIRDAAASKFSLAFYELAHKGLSLGDAFAEARSQIAPGDPTRFAYTYFGDPDAKLAFEGATQ